MKMIAKISQGKGFRGALDYVFKKDAETIGGNMAGKNARELAAEFGVTRKLREDIDTCCYHVSLSLPAGEKLSSQEWEKISSKYLSKMGLYPTDHQYIIVRHQDKELDHIHIITSRVALDGTVWKPFRDRIKSKDVCRLLEKEYHLTAVSNEKKQYRAQTTQKERRMSERTGREPEKVFVQKTMNEILTEGTSLSPQVFCSELEKHGIIAVPNIATTGKMNGFSFQYAGRSYTGSQIGYAWKHLEKFIDIKPEDISWMRARKSRLQEGTPSDAVRSIRNAVWETGVLGVPFETALEKQGWKIQAGRLTKGESSYELSSIVDSQALEHNLQELNSISKKVKEKAQAKSRTLAKNYHAQPRKTFFAEMKTEDVLCSMILFPEVVLFLLALSVLAEAVRDMDKPKTEAEFRERMREIWKEADETVQLEVSRIKGEMKDARNTRGNPANQPKSQELGRGAGTESADRGQGDAGLGAAVNGNPGRDQGEPGSHPGDRGEATVAKADPYRDDSAWVFWGDSPAPAGFEPARSQQSDVQVAPDAGAIAEWVDLAQDLAILSGGEEMAKKTKAKTKSVLYKEQVWDRQHSALKAPLYRVTVRGRGIEEGKTINLCKRKDGTEATWTANEVKAQIPSLEYWNARGYDVYITPMDEAYHHILIDDLTASGVEHLKAAGFSPCLVQVSSADNYQAILRVPKAEVSSEEQSCANILLQKLNALPDGCGGDRAISAPRHPFRMTGFNNKKPARNNVQTKIESLKPGEVCSKATEEMEAIREARAAYRRRETEERNKIETRTRRHAIETVRDRTIQRPDGETDVDKDFRFRWNKFHGLAKKNVREGIWQNVDDSAIDFRVCKEMMLDGYDEESTAKALQRCSPGLFDRHRNPDDYVRRTIAAAMQEILREAPKNEPQGPSLFGR